jgi:lipopolysaccharide transport system permease protein
MLNEVIQQTRRTEIKGRQDEMQAVVNDQDQKPKLQASLHFVLEPSRGWFSLQLRDLWQYRELLYFLAWRDIKVRYKQSALGVAWVILQPILIMVVFSIFFGNFAQIPSDGFPYPIFTYVALLPWRLFAGSLSLAGTSLVMNQGLITKVYFPRLLVPLSAVFVGLVDFGIAFVVLLGLMTYYGIAPTVAIFTLPIFIMLAILTAFGVGLWLSALNVQYRDVQHIIPFLIQIWLFATPIAYPSSMVPEQWRFLYGLNPMVGVIEGFRWALLGQTTSLNVSTIISVVVTVLVLITGLIYFRRMERTFADVV